MRALRGCVNSTLLKSAACFKKQARQDTGFRFSLTPMNNEVKAIQWRDNLRAAMLVMLMALVMVINDVLMKQVLQEMPIFQSLFIRGLILLPLTFGLLYWRGEFATQTTKRDKMVIFARCICEAILAYTILKALAHMPLANVIIILQAVPFAMTIAAAFYLKETVRWRRWLSVIIGFIGVLIIIQPGTKGFNAYALYAVGAVFFFVIRDMLVKQLPQEISSSFIAAPMVVTVMLTGAVMSPFTGWVDVKVMHLLWLTGAGIMITSSYLLSIMIMRIGDVSFVSPFRYSGILWAILAGMAFFDEVPNASSLIGASIIMGAGIYALHRERLNRGKT